MSYCVMHARGFNHALTSEQELDEWRGLIEELAGCAEESSILLTLENADYFHDLHMLAKVVREVSSKWLKIAFDVGHAHIRRVRPLSTYPLRDVMLRALDAWLPLFITDKNMPYEYYGSVDDFIKSESDLISVVHVHDYNGRHDHLPLTEGKIDFSFLPKLKSSKRAFILEAKFEDHCESFRRCYAEFKRLMGI